MEQNYQLAIFWASFAHFESNILMSYCCYFHGATLSNRLKRPTLADVTRLKAGQIPPKKPMLAVRVLAGTASADANSAVRDGQRARWQGAA